MSFLYDSYHSKRYDASRMHYAEVYFMVVSIPVDLINTREALNDIWSTDLISC